MTSSALLGRVRRDAELLPTLALRDLRSRYRHSVLDVLWALITPMLVLTVYGTVLTRSFEVESACSPYLSSAWLGLVVWTFFATALGNSVSSLVSSSELITKVYFPREAIPLATVSSAGTDLVVGLLSLLLVIYVQGVGLDPAALWSLLPIAVVVIWSAALSVIAAAAAVFARDVVHGVHVFLRIAFFATPVVYEASFLPSAFAWVTTWSPIAVAIDAMRSSMLCGVRPDVSLVLAHLAAGAALLAAGVLYVCSIESRLVDVS